MEHVVRFLLRLCLLVYMPLSFVALCPAQERAREENAMATFTADTLQKGALALYDVPWRFHSGDSLHWKDPGYPDSAWQAANIVFGNENPLSGWNGIGWFRLWIRADSTIVDKMLGMYINHDGASEIYLDGQYIDGIGKVGHSKEEMVARREPYRIRPLQLTDTHPHLLAIRYSNFYGHFPDFVGFQVWVRPYNEYAQAMRNYERDNTYAFYGIMALLSFVLLHLILFAFNPKQKQNLYYSLMLFCGAASGYVRLEYNVTTSPAVQAWMPNGFLFFYICTCFFFALFCYSIGYVRWIKWRIAIFASLALLQMVLLFGFDKTVFCENCNSIFNRFINLYVILIFLDGTWAVIKAKRKGKAGLWPVIIGLLFMSMLVIFVAMNPFGFWTSGYTVNILINFGFLVMPLSFSVYLSMDIARTNKNLRLQLEENEKLAAQNLAQETEKREIIEAQAERLEVTVKERTAEVQRQADKLREMDSMKSRFFVNLTHEFRTPLSLVLGPAKEIIDKTGDPAISSLASLIRKNAGRLLGMINQLLDLGKLEAGKMEVHAVEVEAVAFIRQFLSNFDSMARERQLELTFDTPLSEWWLELDEGKLETIMANLVSNAIKFTPYGGSIKVRLNALENGETKLLELIVDDSGEGIPSHKLLFIFDRFYQADASDTRAQEGTGIGLALTKELVELLGGVISVQSREGQGTRIAVKLPAIPAMAHKNPAPAVLPNFLPEAARIASDTDLNANENEHLPQLLLVEDNQDMRHFIRSSLRGKYGIMDARNGKEGVRLAEEHIPDLVITDLMMPEMDGFELSSILKHQETTSHIPIIMLTAKAGTDSKITGWGTGADGYLTKPFDKDELIALADSLMANRRKLAEHYGSQRDWGKVEPALPSVDRAFVHRILTIVEEHLHDEGFDVDTLGEKSSLSRTQLYRKLKALSNQSPGDFIRAARLQRAFQLLKNGHGNVSEIAYQVGFGNPANFSTSFSRHFGFAPSEAAKH